MDAGQVMEEIAWDRGELAACGGKHAGLAEYIRDLRERIVRK